MKKLGLIINPIAGMGGKVGLKGTDNCLQEALNRGATPQANDRVRLALAELEEEKHNITIYTFAGDMGGNLAEEMQFQYQLMDANFYDIHSSKKDTRTLAQLLKEKGMDLILFAGGDGTARNIYEAVGIGTPVLGIPAGVKIHSPVYAIQPKAAGQLAKLFLQGKIQKTRDEEVLDIDEEEYRQGRINTKLYGYLTIPSDKKYTQNRKAPSALSDTANTDAIAYEIIENMEEGTYYLIGAGTSLRGIMHHLNLKNTLIGVDLVYNKKLIANDIYGEQILQYICGKKCKLIVTVTGGQGFLFGRGNQQLTPEVIREVGKENIIILMTKGKLAELRGHPLIVDTSDSNLDKELCGYYKVITGYHEYAACKVTNE